MRRAKETHALRSSAMGEERGRAEVSLDYLRRRRTDGRTVPWVARRGAGGGQKGRGVAWNGGRCCHMAGRNVDKTYRTHKKRTKVTNQYVQTFSLPVKSPRAFFVPKATVCGKSDGIQVD